MSIDQIRLVAFDFDGTLLEGHSPVRMVRRLVLKRIIPSTVALKTLWWGIRYKMHVQVEQKTVRKYIFKGFSHYPAREADRIMSEFYHDELAKRLRPKAMGAIRRHQSAGDRIVIVSASFAPILREVSKDIDAVWFICTQMEIEDDYYTGNVEGQPPEGEEKLIQLKAWADATYTQGGWRLVAAYGDHRSDQSVLAAAETAVAVNPDKSLERVAQREGWTIVDWSFEPEKQETVNE